MSSPIAADAPEALARPDDLVAALARWLRLLHRVDGPDAGAAGATDATVAADGLPAADPETYLRRARARWEAGDVEPSDFDEPYRPHDPERLLAIAAGLVDTLAAKPGPARRPVHGALRLGDLRIAAGEVVEPAPHALSVGDPYVDLAFLARDLSTAIGGGAVPALFDAYGDARPDPVRIELWVTLRQFWA